MHFYVTLRDVGRHFNALCNRCDKVSLSTQSNFWLIFGFDVVWRFDSSFHEMCTIFYVWMWTRKRFVEVRLTLGFSFARDITVDSTHPHTYIHNVYCWLFGFIQQNCAHLFHSEELVSLAKTVAVFFLFVSVVCNDVAPCLVSFAHAIF